MQVSQPEIPQRIYTLYDGKCPLCRFGVKNYELDCDYGELELLICGKPVSLKKKRLLKDTT